MSNRVLVPEDLHRNGRAAVASLARAGLAIALHAVDRATYANPHQPRRAKLGDRPRGRIAGQSGIRAAGRDGEPAVYGFREHVDDGGLISYGINLAENSRRAADYVVKILKGSRPGDLPVEFRGGGMRDGHRV